MKEWPLAGPFLSQSSVVSTLLLDDHHLVVMAMAAVPAAVVATKFGTRTESMIAKIAVMVIATLFDDHCFGACNRRGSDGNRAESCKDVAKLLHFFLLIGMRNKQRTRRNVPSEASIEF